MSELPLRILYVAAEAAPYARVGGLADVAGALPRALRALGHDVRLMIPRYGAIRGEQFEFKRIAGPFPVPVGSKEEYVDLVSSEVAGETPAYLIWNESYFASRDRIYGFEDDAQRFVIFGRAAVAALKMLDWKPDVIHTNDWHTGVVPAWLDTDGRRDSFYRGIATLFTIHDLAYQGITGRLILAFARMEQLKHLPVERPGTVNWTAQATAHADLVSTVSPHYAQEVLTPAMGMGLDTLLRERQGRLFGVLNGIDYDEWNPATDSHIPHRFTTDQLDRRATNKAALQQQARLPVRPDVPLVGLVSRLDMTRGMDILEPVLQWLLRQDVQFVVLGTGEAEYHEVLERVQGLFPDNLRVFLRSDDVLARRIYAGADAFLMPSAIEPCGSAQMVASRYGCVPIVRATGGLADSVTDHAAAPGHGTGFTFVDYSPEACQGALERALRVYQDKKAWRGLQQRGMMADFSWSASAQGYVRLYRQAMALHKA